METLFIGKNTIFLPETDSTNSYAIGLLRNVNPPEGTVVFTAYQKAGRGQRGSCWQSEPLSNLTASVILRPTFLPVKEHFLLYQLAALACLDTLSQLLHERQYDIKIKWPNDILVNGRKICGTLIENGITTETIKYSVIGIGMNLNQQNFEVPNATSFKLLTGENIAARYVLEILCRQLEKHYLALKQNRFALVHGIYHSNLFGLDNARLFEYNKKVLALTVKGVSNYGLLHLEDEEGGRIEADVKEIRWIF